MKKILPYKDIQKIDNNLFCVDGSMPHSPVGRRMTIVVLECGELVIHSGIKMHEDDMSKLEQLGRVGYIIIPNSLHDRDAAWYAQRYPEAKVFIPYLLVNKYRKKLRIDGTFAENWPSSLISELPCIEVKGVKMHEAAFFHSSSKTLILTDLVFNCKQGDFTGLSRWLMKYNNALDRFGPTRVFKMFFLKDARQLMQSVEEILRWDFQRVIMGHGDILAIDGYQALENAFATFKK